MQQAICSCACVVIWLWHYKESHQPWKLMYPSYTNMWTVVQSLNQLLLNQVVADTIVRSINATYELFLIELTWRLPPYVHSCCLYSLIRMDVNKNERMLSSSQLILVSLTCSWKRLITFLTGKFLWALPRNRAAPVPANGLWCLPIG